ncbi:MAG TPA: lysylphosphatidylglycerol synthase transmembrane domain-containing protein [Solirubrobacteraceae bacterium]|nr:lysylphosphatidylglycerol synthase transmembrane domain-containing protein [Solirubrobacteraceae bacterium]
MTGANSEHGAPINPRDRRRRRVRVLVTALLSIISVGVLLWVAPPAQVIDSIGDMSPAWLLAAVGLEIGSCLSYVVVFRRFFPEPPRPVSRQVAWIAMGAGAVLPGGNFSSAATTGWLLRDHGIGARRLVERCGALLCFLTLFGFFVNGVAGAALIVGIGHGPHDLAHSGIPILVSLFVIGLAVAAMIIGRRYHARAPAAARSVAASLHGAWESLLNPHWRMLGAAGFLWLDMAALWASCRATGHPIGVLALAVAYFIGYLATMIPMPAGLGVLDSGLAGALVLYGFSPSASVGAVLVYHAISVWVPGLGGLVAWLPTRARVPANAVGTAPPAEADVALATSQ